MEWFPASKDHLPLTWWKQTPVYLAAVLALGGVASMVLTALLMAATPDWIEPLVFQPGRLLRYGWVWTLVTYVLINPPSLWFLLTSYLLYSFGEALERHLGRRSFVKLVMALVLVTPLLLTIISFTGLGQLQAVGMGNLEFGVFIAFAALYPSARVSIIILTMEVWVLASAIVAVGALMSLASRDWAGLFSLAGEVATAVGYIRYEQGILKIPSLRVWTKPRSKAAYRKGPTPVKRAPSPASKSNDLDDVDDILEKISRFGIASLTPAEKRTLEKASEHLSKRGSQKR